MGPLFITYCDSLTAGCKSRCVIWAWFAYVQGAVSLKLFQHCIALGDATIGWFSTGGVKMCMQRLPSTLQVIAWDGGREWAPGFLLNEYLLHLGLSARGQHGGHTLMKSFWINRGKGSLVNRHTNKYWFNCLLRGGQHWALWVWVLVIPSVSSVTWIWSVLSEL